MVDSRCVDYVRANKDKYPLEAIKQALAKSGVAAPDIEEAVRLAAGTSPYSHPGAPVRHSYPLADPNAGFGAAVGLCVKTLPFIGLRLGLLVGFTIAAVVWFFITLTLAAFAARAGGMIGLFVYLIAFGGPAGLFYWFKRYVLYMLEMAHVAVLTRLITHGELEPGKDQISYGKDTVAASFGEVNLLLVLQSLVNGVVSAFMGTVDWLTHLLPLPGLGGVMSVLHQIMRYATRYVDDAIFSYNLARGDENQWRSSKDGLIYYAQNWKPVIKTAVVAFVIEHAVSFAGFMAVFLPTLLVAGHMPRLGGALILAAILLAGSVKSAVLRPLFSTMVMLSFHKAVQNQPIDEQLDATLTSASDKFRDLTERAKNWAGRQAPLPSPAGR